MSVNAALFERENEPEFFARKCRRCKKPEGRCECETCGTCNGDGEGGTYYGDGSPCPCPDCRGEGLTPLK